MIKLPKIDPDKVFTQISTFVVDFVRSRNATGCVIGLSGGIDSSVTGAIIQKALENTDLELVGYSLPNERNEDDIKDVYELVTRYNIKHQVVDIKQGINQIGTDIFSSSNQGMIMMKYHYGNLASRTRAVYINTLGAIQNKVVAGTGNNDEDEAIGYYTLFGDGAVHCSPIGGLSKRLVYEMAHYLGKRWGFPKNIFIKTPTAGLEPGQTDEGDLGYGYDVVEYIKEGFKQGHSIDEIMDFLEESKMHFDTKKLLNWKDVISDYIHRNDIAKLKQSLISPQVAPVELIYD